MNSPRIALGSFDVFGLRDGYFFLDGGAMFGVVPKVIWQKLIPADESNRIQLGLNSLLIDTGEKKVLVDTGIGENLPSKYAEFYSPRRISGLFGELKKNNMQPEDIDYVINTHLHFDHSGGNTVKDEEGNFHPAFSNAEYVIQEKEWNNAIQPKGRDKPSYMDYLYFPIEREDQLHLVEGEEEILPGITVMPATGHTTGHQIVRVQSGNSTLFFLGDLIPTALHVHLPYIMGYDQHPAETFESKERFLEKAVKKGWIVAFNHDPNHFFGRISEKDGKFVFQPLN